MQNTNKFLPKEAIYIDGKDKASDIQSYSFVGEKCIVTLGLLSIVKIVILFEILFEILFVHFIQKLAKI